MKTKVLHLTADYPDVLQRAKTRAVEGLVEGTADEFEHLVVSLNRKGGLAGLLKQGHVLQRRIDGSIMAIEYAAPPASIALTAPMRRLAVKLPRYLKDANFKPDVIQAHKLTIEGLLARELARLLGVPFVLTLQGNTDQKLLERRPDRLPKMRRIWRDAKAVMVFAPWTAMWASRRLGRRANAISIIPCILPFDEVIAPASCGHLVRTAFSLDFWRNKNITTLLQAIARLAPQLPTIRLEIAGGGSATAQEAINAQVRHLGLEHRVSMVGPIASEAIQAWFNGAAAFALPTRRESFGMVFVESLLAGTPVVYPRGRAIDGFFEHQSFARDVSAYDPAELAEVLGEMLTHQDEIKAELAAAQQAGDLDLFRRRQVLDAYRQFLKEACH
ncbi:MAG: glycosyltransferase family 4 protein [Novosphingobium sp.]|jgi:glycosyltransferase involved in cell wall biosynthesis